MAEGELGAAFKALAKSAADAAERVTAKAAQLAERTAEIEKTNLDALARTDQKAADAITAAGRKPGGTSPINVLPSSGKTFVTTPWGRTYDVPAGWPGRVADNGRGLVFQKPGSTGGSSVTLSPEADPTGLGPVLACARTAVVAATAFEDGRLHMVFADGSALAVPTAQKYESWNVVGPGGFRIVSGPGPKLTVWPGEDPTAS